MTFRHVSRFLEPWLQEVVGKKHAGEIILERRHTFRLLNLSWRFLSSASLLRFNPRPCWMCSFASKAFFSRFLIWLSKEPQRRPALMFLFGGRIVWAEPRENLKWNAISLGAATILVQIRVLACRVEKKLEHSDWKSWKYCCTSLKQKWRKKTINFKLKCCIMQITNNALTTKIRNLQN